MTHQLDLAELVVEVDDDDAAEALYDYFPESTLERFLVSDSTWFAGLAPEDAALVRRYRWLPIAVHARALRASDREAYYLEKCRDQLGLEICRPQKIGRFFLGWQAMLLGIVSEAPGSLIQLVSGPGQGKTTGVNDVAAHLAGHLVTLDAPQLVESTWGRTPAKFAAFAQAVDEHAEASQRHCILFIDEADALFPDTSRDTDIAGEVKAVKLKFNRWLERKSRLVTVIMAANAPLERSISSRARPVNVILDPNDLTNVVADLWPVDRATARACAKELARNGCADLRDIHHVKRESQSACPAPKDVAKLLQWVKRPSAGSGTSATNHQIAQIWRKVSEIADAQVDLAKRLNRK
jgi:hypothetical protein